MRLGQRRSINWYPKNDRGKNHINSGHEKRLKTDIILISIKY
jgi:hypothetical protein